MIDVAAIRNRFPYTTAARLASNMPSEKDDLSSLLAHVDALNTEIEELKVQDIVSRNPGIDIDEVRRTRASGAAS